MHDRAPLRFVVAGPDSRRCTSTIVATERNDRLVDRRDGSRI
jgi:hypothetical protein